MRLLAALAVTTLLAQDTVITGARIADGTGAPLKAGNVRIQGDTIMQVGSFRPSPGDRVINATGLILAPGFIDPHNHSDRALAQQPDAASQVSQGITTVLLGQDGGSGYPIAQWLQGHRDHPSALNVATLIGHATLRTQVMGKDYQRAAKPEEVSRMAQLLEQAMQDGAFGLSSGLEYEVGSYSNTAELITLAKTVARQGGFYMSHLRDEGDKAIASVQELIRIASEAKLPAQISHIKLGSVAVWGQTAEVNRLVLAARLRGLDVNADCYPYEAWSSTITVLVLDKQHDNPQSVAKGLADVGGPQNVTVTSCQAHPDYEFQNLAQIATKTGLSAIDAYRQIVRDGGASVVVKAMQEADVRTFYRQPWVMVSSDGGIGSRHPRGAGSYPRVLGRLVREEKVLTWEKAIHKMTAMPADRLKLTDRGRIAAGKKADLVLFNPDTVVDRSTFQDPLALSIGIEKVWVNGQLVWNEGRSPGVHSGMVLLHSPR